MLEPGDPAPYFSVASSVNPQFHFDTAAGRLVVLCFFASSRIEFAAGLLEHVRRRADRFNVSDAIFFGVSVDPEDRGRLRQGSPGVVYFFDDDLSVSVKYGVASEAEPPEEEPRDGAAGPPPGAEEAGPRTKYHPRTFVLDQALRVVAIIEFGGDPAAHLAEVLGLLDELPKPAEAAAPAPVLAVPYVFEPQLCRELIRYYETNGGQDSGFMRDMGGKTVMVMDYSHKRRADCEITDPALIRTTQERLSRRVIPAIRQAFQFDATRIERHIVACYDASDGGHFRAHRDNTTLGTAHRRFAVTLNLNSEEFDGGELWFPEFSRRRYKAPTGGAIVFSCSLLHEATRVTRGRRYAFLPFLYDDAAAKVRERNRQHIAAGPPVVAGEGAAGAS